MLAASSRCGTRRRLGLSGARLRKKLPMRLGASRARLSCASRISGKGRPNCTTYRRCRNSAARDFGWPASKTFEAAQELYDGQGKKIITYLEGVDGGGSARRHRQEGD